MTNRVYSRASALFGGLISNAVTQIRSTETINKSLLIDVGKKEKNQRGVNCKLAIEPGSYDDTIYFEFILSSKMLSWFDLRPRYVI